MGKLGKQTGYNGMFNGIIEAKRTGYNWSNRLNGLVIMGQ